MPNSVLKKLKGKKVMARLFESGQRKRFKNVSLIFLERPEHEGIVFFTVGVPKKNIPLAVNRNLLKRRLREAVYSYTDWNNRKDLTGAFMVFFNGRKIEESSKINENIKSLLDHFFAS